MLSNVEILPPDGFAMTNAVEILEGLSVPNLEGLNVINAARAKRIVTNDGRRREADLDQIALILECEQDEQLKAICGGWRGLFELCGVSAERISHYWKIADVLARPLGIARLRMSNIRERRQMYEIALLAEAWQSKRNLELPEAAQSAIEQAQNLKREQIVDLRFGRLDYDPATRDSAGALGSIPKNTTPSVKRGVKALAAATARVESEATGQTVVASSDAAWERLGSILENDKNGWLVETLAEWAATSQTPLEFFNILRKRLGITRMPESDASDMDIALLLDSGLGRDAVCKQLGVGKTRVTRVQEALRGMGWQPNEGIPVGFEVIV